MYVYSIISLRIIALTGLLIVGTGVQPVRAMDAQEQAVGQAALGGQLIAAVKVGNGEEVARLLAAGADVDTADEEGGTSLIWAAGRGFSKVVEQLIEAGADINVMSNEKCTALTKAVLSGDGAIVDLLIKAGARVDGEVFVFGLLCGKCMGTNLMQAAYLGRSEIVAQLLEARADVNGVNGSGETPLILAVEAEYDAVVAQLLEAGSDLNWADRNGKTVLMRAVETGCIDMVSKLLIAYIDKCTEIQFADREARRAFPACRRMRWLPQGEEALSGCESFDRLNHDLLSRISWYVDDPGIDALRATCRGLQTFTPEGFDERVRIRSGVCERLIEMLNKVDFSGDRALECAEEHDEEIEHFLRRLSDGQQGFLHGLIDRPIIDLDGWKRFLAAQEKEHLLKGEEVLPAVQACNARCLQLVEALFDASKRMAQVPEVVEPAAEVAAAAAPVELVPVATAMRMAGSSAGAAGSVGDRNNAQVGQAGDSDTEK